MKLSIKFLGLFLFFLSHIQSVFSYITIHNYTEREIEVLIPYTDEKYANDSNDIALIAKSIDYGEKWLSADKLLKEDYIESSISIKSFGIVHFKFCNCNCDDGIKVQDGKEVLLINEYVLFFVVRVRVKGEVQDLFVDRSLVKNNKTYGVYLRDCDGKLLLKDIGEKKAFLALRLEGKDKMWVVSGLPEQEVEEQELEISKLWEEDVMPEDAILQVKPVNRNLLSEF